jgi:hypothetical protein
MYDNNHSELCDCCKTTIETEDHILRCGLNERYSIREEWIRDLTEYLTQSHTSEEVKLCIMTGVTIWLNNDLVQQINNEILAATRTAFRRQNHIGWDHFIQGRISTSWGDVIKHHLQNQGIKNTTAKQWVTSLISINWKHINALWIQRNKEMLGDTVTDQCEKRKQKLIGRIMLLQQQYPDLPASQRMLIDADHEMFLELSEAIDLLFTWSYDDYKTM